MVVSRDVNVLTKKPNLSFVRPPTSDSCSDFTNTNLLYFLCKLSCAQWQRKQKQQNINICKKKRYPDYASPNDPSP
jgi:hypothetical protein